MATSEPIIPASTSPLPAVASHGVAFGSSIRKSGCAIYVVEPFKSTVTLNFSVATIDHFLGSASIASDET